MVLTRASGLVTSGALVFVALAIAAVVGVTRIYLRAHWWSDVGGGWGLGAAVFALLGGDRPGRRRTFATMEPR